MDSSALRAARDDERGSMIMLTYTLVAAAWFLAGIATGLWIL